MLPAGFENTRFAREQVRRTLAPPQHSELEVAQREKGLRDEGGPRKGAMRPGPPPLSCSLIARTFFSGNITVYWGGAQIAVQRRVGRGIRGSKHGSTKRHEREEDQHDEADQRGDLRSRAAQMQHASSSASSSSVKNSPSFSSAPRGGRQKSYRSQALQE